MVSRREFLVGAGTAGLTSLAGCSVLGGSDDQSFQGTPETMSPGESVTYGGLEMAATDYRTTERGTDNRGERVADEGDIYLLVQLRVGNVSGSHIAFPRRDGEVRVRYRGEQVTDGFAWGQLTVDGLDEPDADVRAPPDTVVSGWTIFVLPEGFDPSETVVAMQYRDDRADDLEFTWRLEE
jgi:hypothetical protein